MRDDYRMQGRMFVNFLTLIIHNRIYGIPRGKNLLRKYSPVNVTEHLERVSMLKIGEEWKISEIPKHSREVIAKLDITI
ncbi:MAG: hypothetical protein M1463_02120 [Candidatus Thermoplasmatota archaeon]|nr:hypothetical protein [Candidatus Thermoplasmatota archaeon]